MLAFDTLTGPGRMRRLHPLAKAAIAHWNLEAPTLRPMAQSMNALFRVDTSNGERFVLRVFQPGQHRLEDRQLEALWTQALAADNAANVPEPIRTPHGEYLVTANAHGVPEPRTCMLIRWVSGKPISDSPAHYTLLGAEMARLHRHSDTFRVPAILQPRRYDHIYCFQNDTIKLHDVGLGIFTDHQQRAIQTAEALAIAEINALWVDAQPQLIHGDLSNANTLISRNRLCLIDFEDVMLGFPAQDIAIAFYHARGLPNFPELYQAFKAGYSSIRAWPLISLRQLDTLIMSRLLVLLNFCCNRLHWDDIVGWRDSLATCLEQLVHKRLN